jgi:hypothetical protein
MRFKTAARQDWKATRQKRHSIHSVRIMVNVESATLVSHVALLGALAAFSTKTSVTVSKNVCWAD